MLVAPSLLACDFSKMREEVQKIEKSGADFIHFDVMDGNFVPNISFGPDVIKSLRNKTNLPFDVHLMVKNPINFIEKIAIAGADYITFHLESNFNIIEIIKKIKKYGKKVGLAIKPATPAEKIFEFLKHIDLCLVMTVEPGLGGQKFLENQIQKIKTLSEKIKKENLDILLSADGGINLETAKICKENGIDMCVAGSFLFKNNMKEKIKSIKGLT